MYNHLIINMLQIHFLRGQIRSISGRVDNYYSRRF